MELRIKELCKEKGITQTEIAERIGISNVNLSNSLNGNPTLARLKEVADILQVEVWQLFKKEQDISGIVQYKGAIYPINDFSSLYALTDKVKAENE
ncbi:helix-turn-helix domain-containing protein [Rikenella microfusus]|uniref:Helix-turn-helix domain n=1 Tax=Rikenella microfusus TaxID=28139 RepID=A0A379MVE1_9BACT|nr:helix-turn-helix transcriptional regulator [Rikenella microfusus]SUE34612.1 Helix-turn-helix domain [Rikenella microfusus]